METTMNGELKIDLNQIRRILVSDYSELCYTLNNSYKKASNKDEMIINPHEIKSCLDSMRYCIACLASSYFNGCEEFQVIDVKQLPVFDIEQE